VAWYFLWLFSDWKRRRSLFLGFAATLGLLLLVSERLRPDWIVRYPGVLRDYAIYTHTKSFLWTYLSTPWDWLATILALAIVANYCWRVRRQPANSPAFAVALSLVLALTVLIVPALGQPFNYVLLLPAVLLTIRYWRDLRRSAPLILAVIYTFCFCAFLPWLLAVVAVAQPLNVNREWLLNLWSLPLAATIAFPFPAFGMLIVLRRVASQPFGFPNGGSVLLQATGAVPAKGEQPA
jgi:hypothetical protein